MSTKTLSIIAAVAVVVMAATAIFFMVKPANDSIQPGQITSNVSMEGDKQIIVISARNGYSPKATYAKDGIPTTIRFKANGAFDCSSAVVIPSIGYQANLAVTGESSVDVPAQSAGSTLRGTCTMGMYGFSITFN